MTTYSGTSGNDFIRVEDFDGTDFIDEGDGNDFIEVIGSINTTGHIDFIYREGHGSFTIATGPGQDTVQPFAYRVTVTDFDPALDRIDLSLRDHVSAVDREAYQILADGSDAIITHLGGQEQIRLLNVAPSSLNSTNIVGANPIRATLPGTSDADALVGSAISESSPEAPETIP